MGRCWLRGGRGEGGRCWLIGDDRTLYVAGGRGGGGIYTCMCGTGGREDAAWEGGGGGGRGVG